jgi:hypothetical protein
MIPIYTKREREKGGKEDGEFAFVCVLPSIELCVLYVCFRMQKSMKNERAPNNEETKAVEYDHPPAHKLQ